MAFGVHRERIASECERRRGLDESGSAGRLYDYQRDPHCVSPSNENVK